MSDEKLYDVDNRDIIAQGEVYARHVVAMTREALHNKADIAAELAHRDIRIAELACVLEGKRRELAAAMAERNAEVDRAERHRLAVFRLRKQLLDLRNRCERAEKRAPHGGEDPR